ncbi:hypothetical protein ACLI4Q_06405 [Natrialbaceae archaeon A-CW1-1]
MIDKQLKVATFEVDATPEVGKPIEYGTVESITDSLSCRGIVLLSDELPVVLVSVDWLGNFNGGYDLWRNTLADTAKTTPNRVAVHTVHQHEAPGFDMDAVKILHSHGVPDAGIDVEFASNTIRRAANALREALASPSIVTNLGIGTAEVKKVASNRLLIGQNGNYAQGRPSSENNPEVRKLPEGVIDPKIRIISFWDGDNPKAALSYYATHPQSYWGDRDVTCDFVGLARNRSEKAWGVPLIHFTGAAGNVAAGKYNDGSEEARSKLTQRLAAGMDEAWESTKHFPITTGDVEWRVRPVSLPIADWIEENPLVEALSVSSNSWLPKIHKNDIPKLLRLIYLGSLINAPINLQYESPPQLYSTILTRRRYPHIAQIARDLVWFQRCKAGDKIPLTSLQIGDVCILNTPGELFVEYQLAACEMRPDLTVAVAAYGDCAPFYIGTREAYKHGGYGTGMESKVSPEVEGIFIDAFCDLLRVSNDEEVTTPSEITSERKPRINQINPLNCSGRVK